METDNFGGPAEPPPRVPLPSPLRWVIAAALGLIVAAGAFVGGWAAGKYGPKPGDRVYGQPVAPAPADWTEWKYPNAAEFGRASGLGTSSGTARVGPLHVAELRTPDSFEQVLAHYATKFGQPSVASPAGGGSGSGTRFTPAGMEVFNFAQTVTGRPGLKGKLITYRASNYDVVIDVTRADAEKHTHIVVSYMPHP